MTDRKEYKQKWYIQNRDRILKKTRRYGKDNPEYHKQWCKDNLKHIAAYMRQYRKDNPEYYRSKYDRGYYLEHDGKNRKRMEDVDRKGKNSSSWKGGKTKHSQGYKMLWVDPESPFAKMRDHHGYVERHRLTMAKYLGRCLEIYEIVHHINEIKTDDRIENLELTDNSKHAKMHNKNRLRDKLGKFVKIINVRI